MAREFSRVKLSIWNDPDFRTRSVDAQALYFTLLTHPQINACGVVEWRENKLTKFSADMTSERLREAAWNLGQADLIAVDPDTEEALVRSFVRHDGVLQSPNMTRALVREHAGIASLRLMALVSREVRRAFVENPEWKGLAASEPVRKQFPDADGNPFEMVPEWFHAGSEMVPVTVTPNEGEPFANSFKTVPPFPQPSAPTSNEVDDAPRKRAARIPDPFEITDAMRHWAVTNAAFIDVDRETQNFVDYWTAKGGKDATKLDWPATWRKWMRTQSDRVPVWKRDQPAAAEPKRFVPPYEGDPDDLEAYNAHYAQWGKAS